jgi:hypothetical protein
MFVRLAEEVVRRAVLLRQTWRDSQIADRHSFHGRSAGCCRSGEQHARAHLRLDSLPRVKPTMASINSLFNYTNNAV